MSEQAPGTQNPQYTRLLELIPKASDGAESSPTDHTPGSVATTILDLVKRARAIPRDKLRGTDDKLRPYGGQSGFNVGLTKTVDIEGTPREVLYEAQIGGTNDETLAGYFDVMLDVNDGTGSVGTIDGLSGEGHELTGHLEDGVTKMEPHQVQEVTGGVLGLFAQAVAAREQ